MSDRYPENRIQADATIWMAANWGYEEFFTDIGAIGARLDSAGLMRGRLVLIEVKVAVSEQIVRFADDRPMSLESKIAGGLGALYRGEGDTLSTAANARWSRRSRPLLTILAARYSDPALVALKTMLAARSIEWEFDAAVWQWTGSVVKTLLEVSHPPREGIPFGALDLPKLVGRSTRPGPSSLEELLQRAEPLGQRALLESFIVEAKRAHMPLKRQRQSVIASRRSPQGKLVPALGFYLDEGNPNEANIGLNADLVMEAPREFPGRPGPAKGFLNINRLISSADNMRDVFELTAGPQRDPQNYAS